VVNDFIRYRPRRIEKHTPIVKLAPVQTMPRERRPSDYCEKNLRQMAESVLSVKSQDLSKTSLANCRHRSMEKYERSHDRTHTNPSPTKKNVNPLLLNSDERKRFIKNASTEELLSVVKEAGPSKPLEREGKHAALITVISGDIGT
jgi:hypothetical protein